MPLKALPFLFVLLAGSVLLANCGCEQDPGLDLGPDPDGASPDGTLFSDAGADVDGKTVDAGAPPDATHTDASDAAYLEEAGKPDAGAGDGFCSVNDWCWELPQPFGNHIFAVWERAPDDVYVFGAGGLIARFAGGQWNKVASPTTATIRGVWASGPNDAWAVGERETLLHFDGGAWKLVREASGPSGTHFSSIAGDSTGRIWAVAQDDYAPSNDYIYFYDGSTWKKEEGYRYRGVFIESDDTRWMYGSDIVERIRGKEVETFYLPGGFNTTVNTFWAGGDDAYLVIGDSWPMKREGDRFVELDLIGQYPGYYNAIVGSSPSDVWMVGEKKALHFDGSAWTNFWSQGGNFRAAYRGEAYWFAGHHGLLAKKTSTGVEDVRTVTASPDTNPLVARSTADGIVAFSYDGTWVNSGGAWQRAGDGTAINNHWDYDAVSTKSAWAVGTGRSEYFDGARWSEISELDGEHAMSVWAHSDRDVWVGGFSLWHFDGSSWSTVEVKPAGADYPYHDFDLVAGRGPDNVWALSSRGLVHWDGKTWSNVESAAFAGDWITEMWVAPSGDVWAGGADGIVYRYDGQAWSDMTSDSGIQFFWISSITGDASGNVWVVCNELGDVGHVYHWDGSVWAEEETGQPYGHGYIGYQQAANGEELWIAGQSGIMRKELTP